MRKAKYVVWMLCVATLMSVVLLGAEAEAKKSYTVGPRTKVSGRYAKSHDLNANTRHYFMLRYYMDQLEKKGGGTLTLKKGTYKITNILYVPSNVTIYFEDGVKMVKSKKMGKAKFKAADGIFQVVPYSLSQKKKKGKKYNGSKNVSFIGKGNVTIDLKGIKNSKAIVTAHCQNVIIEGITFLNMNNGHFLEVDAAKGLTVRNCTFKNATASTSYTKEAINIDVPDPVTGGVNLYWSSLDRTPDRDVIIENCTFSNLKRGIGSHKYSQKKSGGTWSINCYHENIVIRNNVFSDMKDTGVFMLNWRNVTLQSNRFEANRLCMNFRGVQAPVVIQGNDFGTSTVTQVFGKRQTILQQAYKSPGKGDIYSPIYNKPGFTTLAEILAMNSQAVAG